MSDFADTFAQIEHIEFIANGAGADDAEEFFVLTRPRPPVKTLLAARDPASLVARIRRLVQQPASKNYTHPMDVPIAVYLDVIYRLEATDALREAWGLVRGNETLYWTNQVARSINSREQAAGAVLAVSADAPTGVEPDVSVEASAGAPAPASAEQMAKLLYTEYMAASKVEVEAAGKTFPERPAWDALGADHMFRRVFHRTGAAVLAQLTAVPFIPIPPEDPVQQQAVAQAIRSGTIAARLTLEDV